jgi:putative transposase
MKGCTVKEDKVLSLEGPAEVDAKSPLEQLIAEGARKMLQAAIEQEVEAYLRSHQSWHTADGRATVVRNGHLPERQLVTGVGPIPVRQPRIRHRAGGAFTSAILPKYLRRVREHRYLDSGPLPQRGLHRGF